MVEIRTLKPLVKLRMPQRPTRRDPRRQQYKIVVRHNRDYPPPTPQPTPVRLWQGVEGTDGYGRRKVRDADGSIRSSSMHRWVMEQLLERRLKPSEVVLHACDNRLCYRADHLSVGTVQDNNADMRAKGRNTPPPVNVFHGECHPMAKLQRMRRYAASVGTTRAGCTAVTIAEMFDVSPTDDPAHRQRRALGAAERRDLIAERRGKDRCSRSGRGNRFGGGGDAASEAYQACQAPDASGRNDD